MKKAEIKARAEAFMGTQGIPVYLASVKHVPSHTEISVAIGGQRHTFRVRAGATRDEVDFELGRLKSIWNQRVRDGQTDLEDFTADSKILEPAE